MTENNGGPAFPLTGDWTSCGGMTLRQWYAGMAVMGKADYQTGDIDPFTIKSAFRIADALIEFEQKEKENDRK